MVNKRGYRLIYYVIPALLLVPPALAEEAGEWVSLFDGKTLSGWRAEGKADWTVKDGAIIGRQGPGGAPGDLYTEGEWADFELEAEFKVHWPANSGIWFRRSATQPGYQADILDEPSYPDTFSGSLYAMGTGFLVANSDATSVKKNDWNRLRIRAVGDEIAIGMNGKTVVEARDKRFPGAGSIGIQVHQGDHFKDMEIRVRKIRVRPLTGALRSQAQ